MHARISTGLSGKRGNVEIVVTLSTQVFGLWHLLTLVHTSECLCSWTKTEGGGETSNPKRVLFAWGFG